LLIHVPDILEIIFHGKSYKCLNVSPKLVLAILKEPECLNSAEALFEDFDREYEARRAPLVYASLLEFPRVARLFGSLSCSIYIFASFPLWWNIL